MLLLVTIDLSRADHDLFEEYEAGVLPLLPEHGARLIERVRSIDRQFEVHLLEFPGAAALASFRADPKRAQLQGLWARSGAEATSVEVERRG